MTSNLTRSLYLVALAHLGLELCANFLPVIYPILITTMGLTYTQIGFIALVLGTGSSLSQPLFGYLSDHWDPLRITILSIAWIGLLMGLIGFAQNYLSLLLLVGLGSLGSAAFHPAGATIALASSGTRPGASLSVFSVGGNLGSALSPLWISVGISWLGLRGTTLIIPVALLVSLILFRQLGWNMSPQKQSLPIDQAANGHQVLKQIKSGSLLGLGLIIIAVMCRNWFQVSLATYLPEWMQSQGWSLAAAGQILFIMLVSVSVGSLLGGVLSDRIGRWPIVALSLGLLGPAQWLFLSTSGLLQAGLVGLLGILIGASFPVAIVMAQETWPRGVGLASALVLGLGWLPGGIGASVTGFIADQSSLALGLQSLIIPPVFGVICALGYAFLYRRPISGKVLSEAH
jgi:FSR family fosmidomycin resistance protein-like MFS transporter